MGNFASTDETFASPWAGATFAIPFYISLSAEQCQGALNSGDTTPNSRSIDRVGKLGVVSPEFVNPAKAEARPYIREDSQLEPKSLEITKADGSIIPALDIFY